jgi:hypothetical protein
VAGKLRCECGEIDRLRSGARASALDTEKIGENVEERQQSQRITPSLSPERIPTLGASTDAGC